MTLDAAMTVTRRAGKRAGRQAGRRHQLVPASISLSQLLSDGSLSQSA